MRTEKTTRRRAAWLAAAMMAGVLVFPTGGPVFRQAMAQEHEDDAEAAELYSEGREMLDNREWERAERAFDRVIRSGGRRAEGALYWKAYSQWKQGRGGEALESLTELMSEHPDGRWKDDARALRLEIRQAGGGRNLVTEDDVEGAEDDDIKLMALQSLMHMEPDRAIPLVRGILDGDQSPKMKKTALFVLMQLGTPEARNLVIEIASGAKHPELRREALRHVAMLGDSESHDALRRIYQSTRDPELKREILRDTVMWSGTEMLMDAIHQEEDPDLRRTAIQVLGMKGRRDDLMELYRSDSSVETREVVIQSLLMAGAHDDIAEILRTEKNPDLRRKAIQTLGATGYKGAGPLLIGIYQDSGESLETREAVLQALTMTGNATALIEIARKETDPRLKKRAVQGLSMMRSDEARAFLMEILEE